MASTIQCTPLLVGRRSEGGCVGGTATIPKSNSSSRAVLVPVASRHRTGSGGFEKAVLSGEGKRGAAAGEPVAALFQSLSRSSLFGGSLDSLQHRRGEVLPCSNWEYGNFSRAPRMQAVQAIPGNVEMLEAYEIERKVRDYELDHYGVVNNAIYAQFCQQARTELLENIGFRPDGVTESGKSMAIADMTMKFLSPLRSGDRYIVSSRVAGTTAVRLIFEDHIYRLPERELVTSAKSTVVVLDQNSKPGRLPDEIKIKLVAGYSTNCQVKLTNGHVNGNSGTGHVNGNSTSRNISGSSTSGHVNGKSTNGHANSNSANDHVTNGSSRNGHVNGYSTLNGYVNGNLVKGFVNGYVNGNSMNGLVNGNFVHGYLNGNSVNGNSTIEPVTGHLTSDQNANGSTTNGQVSSKSSNGHLNGNSANGHVNGIGSHSHLISNSTSDSNVNENSTDIHVKYGNSTSGHVNGDSTNDHVEGNSSDDTYN